MTTSGLLDHPSGSSPAWGAWSPPPPVHAGGEMEVARVVDRLACRVRLHGPEPVVGTGQALRHRLEFVAERPDAGVVEEPRQDLLHVVVQLQ